MRVYDNPKNKDEFFLHQFFIHHTYFSRGKVKLLFNLFKNFGWDKISYVKSAQSILGQKLRHLKKSMFSKSENSWVLKFWILLVVRWNSFIYFTLDKCRSISVLVVFEPKYHCLWQTCSASHKVKSKSWLRLFSKKPKESKSWLGVAH